MVGLDRADMVSFGNFIRDIGLTFELRLQGPVCRLGDVILRQRNGK